MQQRSNAVQVGKIISAHGIKGHVKIHSFTTDPKNILSMKLTDHDNREVKIKFVSAQQNILVCVISGVDDRNMAEALRGTLLFAKKSDLPTLSDSEYYAEDLKNLDVKDATDTIVGKVIGIHNFGAGNILEVKFTDGTTQMLPFTKQIFPIITDEYVLFVTPDICD